MMDLADEPSLALQRVGHFRVRHFDPRNGAREGIPQLLDFLGRTEFAGKVEGYARLITCDSPFEPLERADQQSADE